VSLKFVKELFFGFASGHDFSRAVNGAKSNGLQPLRAALRTLRFANYSMNFRHDTCEGRKGECMATSEYPRIEVLGIAFDKRFGPALQEIEAIINDALGTGSTSPRCYPLPAMKELRGALNPPVQSGKKRADGVFVRVIPLHRPIGIRITHQRKHYDFHHPNQFKSDVIRDQIRQWASATKKPRKAITEKEFGDGIALPGGQFESKRRKH
jgi:hypothetical protein